MSNTNRANPNIRKRNGIFSGLTIAFAAAAIFLAVVGGTVAYLFTSTNSATNTFIPGKVECVVEETFNTADDPNTKTSIKVKNTGTTPAYMRVCFTTYWVEEYTENNETKERVVGKTAVLPAFDLGTDWVLGSDGYYYYLNSVAPTDYTGEMLGATKMVLQTEGNFKQVVEVFAQAIQSAPDQAVTDAWGTTKGGAVASANNGTLTVNPAAQG